MPDLLPHMLRSAQKAFQRASAPVTTGSICSLSTHTSTNGKREKVDRVKLEMTKQAVCLISYFFLIPSGCPAVSLFSGGM